VFQPFDRQAALRSRVESLLGECMARHEVDLWLVYTRESSRDPLADDVGLGRVVARSAGLFVRTGNGLSRHAIVASYDTDPVEQTGIFQKVEAYRQEGITPHLKAAVDAIDPKRVALNFSRDVCAADGLAYGMRLHLEEILGARFFDRVVSSEPLVLSFRCRKLPEELETMVHGIEVTQRILRDALTTEIIKPGRTREIDVAQFLRRETAAVGGKVDFDMVMVGPCRGHGDPTDRVIQPGDLLRIDFGIQLDGYISDIQRTAYVLRPGESGPPASVGKLFDTTLRACQAGIAALRPGARGRDVDQAARSIITGAGYDEYPHAAGHAIGVEAHELGPVLGPPWKERYGTAVEHAVEPGMVFAVEPAAYVDLPECGGVVQVGIEEDVIVTAEGRRLVGTPQTELILLPASA
jgi:Xaa-Pro aminopeptidase